MEITREEWLQACIALFRPRFVDIGCPLPDRIRVAVGFTSTGMRSKRIGECWSDSASEDGTYEIFIVPTLDDSARVADILTHELIHVAVGLDKGHGMAFKKAAHALGLKGPMRSTQAGELWYKWALPILTKLGPIPHARLSASAVHSGPKKQATALLKAECVHGCGAVIRITRKWVDHAGGELKCPVCQHDEPMEIG